MRIYRWLMRITHKPRREMLARDLARPPEVSLRSPEISRLDRQAAERVGAHMGGAAARSEGAVQVLQRAHARDDVDAPAQVGGGEGLRPNRLLPRAPAAGLPYAPG